MALLKVNFSTEVVWEIFEISKLLLLGRPDNYFCSADDVTLRIISMKSLAIGGFYSSQNKNYNKSG